MFRRITVLPVIVFMVLSLAACGKGNFPLGPSSSMTKIDADSVFNGQKSLVVTRFSTPWGTPAETRWMQLETGQLFTVTSQFAASTQEVAKEYDMVTLPAGTYVLMYALYSSGTGAVWPAAPFDIDPSLSKVSELGQVQTKESGNITTSMLRSKGLAADGKTPLIAGFTLKPGQALYLGDITVSFDIEGPVQLPGYYPAGKFHYTDKKDLQRAKFALGKENTALASALEQGRMTWGRLARKAP